MDAVVPCLKILMPIVDGDNNVNGMPSFTNVEMPFMAFNSGDSFLLRYLPTTSIGIYPANMTNPLVRIRAISFVDATDPVTFCHNNILIRLNFDPNALIKRKFSKLTQP